MLWHPNGQTLISGDLRGNVKQWDLTTGMLTRSFDAKALHSFNGGQLVDFGGVRGMALGGTKHAVIDLRPATPAPNPADADAPWWATRSR